MFDDSNNPIIAVCYSVPNVIFASSCVIFLFYLGLLYINIFKWRPKDFGKISSLYFLTVSITQLVLGLIIQFSGTDINGFLRLRNCKIFQITNLFVTTISLFLLILLPILKLCYNNALNHPEEDFDSSIESYILIRLRRVVISLSPLFESKTYFITICFLSVLHGCGRGAYELYDTLIQVYVSKDLSYLTSTNGMIKSLSVAGISILFLFLVTFYRRKYPNYVIFFGLGVLLLILLIPLSTLFLKYTIPCTHSLTPSYTVPILSRLDYLSLIGLLLLDIVPTVLFVSFPIVIQYVSKNFEDNDQNTILHLTMLFFISFLIGGVIYKIFKKIPILPKNCITYLTIACYSFGYIILFDYKFPWNIGRFIYYIPICVFSMFIMVAFGNTNALIANLLADNNHRKYKWILQGIIGFVKNLIIFFLMYLIYWTYDKENESIDNDDNIEDQRPIEDTITKSFNLRNLFIVLYLACQLIGIAGNLMLRSYVYS